MAKFGMKKIVLALAGIGLTGTAFAGLTPDSSFSTPTPIGYGWHISGLADWLQPTTNDLNFATVNTSSNNNDNLSIDGHTHHHTQVSSFNANAISVEPSYHWGYGAEVGYQLPGTMDDINVNWSHLNGSDSDSAFLDLQNDHHHHNTLGDSNVRQVLVLPDGTTGYNAASGESDFTFNEVNAEFGHTEIDGNWMVRPFAGLQYANIENDLDTVGYNQNDDEDNNDHHNTNTDSIDQDGQFHGIGPRFGVDAKYNLGYGFGIAGSVAGDLLVGDADASMESTNTTTTSGQRVNTTNVDVDNYQADEARHTIVPGIEAKTGLVYDWAINSATCLGIEAGYMFAGYYHAAPTTIVSVANDDESNSGITGHYSNDSDGPDFVRNEYSNFTYQGPYVALTLNF